MSLFNFNFFSNRESFTRQSLLLSLCFIVSIFSSTLIIAQNIQQDFGISDTAECGSNTQYVQVAGGGFEANGQPVCIDLAAFGVNPADVAGPIPITLYYDLGFSSVNFYTSNNPGTLIPGATNPTSGPGGTVGDHFATAVLPNDGSTQICAIVVVNNNNNAEDMGIFATIPITNPAFCNGSVFGTALDNELIASGGVPECSIGSFPIDPNGDGSQLIDIDLQFTVAEVVPGDPRPIQVMFEACGATFFQELDPEPPAGETGYAILNFTLEDVPSDCDELVYTFCAPPGGQSFGIGGFSAEITCVPNCDITNSGPVCAGSGANILIDTEFACGATYDWTGPNGFSSTLEDPTLFNPSLADAGIYTLTVTSPEGIEVVCQTDVEILEVPDAVGIATNPLCNGDDDGSISFTWVDTGAPRTDIEFSSTGAGGPFISFSYPTEMATNVFTGLAPGTYDLWVRWGNNDCPVDLPDVTIVEPTPVVCTLAGTDLLCNGDASGTITVTASGGTPGYTYSLDGAAAQASNMFTGLAAGPYTVTTIDANGCEIECDIVIAEPTPVVCTVSSAIVQCNGDGGTITVAASGGTPGYTYSIGGAFQASNVFTNLPAAQYTVTTQDANGCEITCTAVVVEPTPVFCRLEGTDLLCNGDASGTITVTAVGGTPGYIYSLDGAAAQTSNMFTGLAAGPYTVTTIDANGCETECDIVLVEPTPVVCTLTGTDLLCNGDASGTITVSADGGTPGYTYSLDGAAAQASNMFTGLAAGPYTVTTIDANGCETECDIVLVEPTPVVCTLAGTDLLCNGDASGTITVTASGGTPGYTYSLDGAAAQASNLFTGLAAGPYTVTTIDANGCETECDIVLVEPTPVVCTLTGTDLLCNGDASGTITVSAAGGTPGYTYSLDGAAAQASNVFTGLAAGPYTVTTIDANGCETECDIVLVETTPVVCTLAGTDLLCNGDASGTITVSAAGGTPGYTYSLDGAAAQASNVFTGLAAGPYTVTTIDANGCETECDIVLIEPTPVVCTLASTDLLCNGDASGTITVTASGGTPSYTYSLDGAAAQASNMFTGLAAGLYTVTTIDANGCETECDIVLVEPTPVVCTLAGTDLLCNGDASGTITVTASGGTPGYTYSLDGAAAQASNMFTGLAAGPYTVTTIDANGCETECDIVLVEPTPVVCTLAGTDLLCNGDASGTITVTAAGGTPGYTYSLDGAAAQGSNIFTGLAAGPYTVTTIDSNGCETECDIVIAEPPVLTCTLTGLDTGCMATEGSASSVVTGGTAPYTFDWSNGATTADINGLMPGIFTLTVTDANGCTTMCDVTIAETGCVFDLALNKIESSAGPYAPGSIVTYDINVFNQGTVDATAIEITDYLPTGTTLVPGGSFAGAPNPTAIIPTLAAGSSMTLTISIMINPTFMGTSIINNAEITDAMNAMGLTDEDDDLANIDGASDDTAQLPTDDDVNDAPDNPADIDDYDIEEVLVEQIFDLALIKTLSTTTPGPFFPGASVVFDITVTNQGTLDAFNIGLIDYIPAGLILADPAWTLAGTSATLTTPIPSLTVGMSTTVPIAFTIDPAFTGTSILNDAEISEADDDMDPNNTAPTDVDSAPGDDATPDDVAGNDDTADTMGGDDQDPEEIIIEFVSIGSTVFEDPNDNGVQDAGEAGIAGVAVDLLDSTGAIIASTVTDTNGDYFFGMLAPGTYQVQIPVPDTDFPTSSTFTDTADNQTDQNDNGDQPGGSGTAVTSPIITLAVGTEPVAEAGTGGMQDAAMDANGDMTIDFGFVPLVSLGSTVFEDPNDNGLQDAGEAGIPGVTVVLLDSTGATVATTTTDTNGDYFFDMLLPGTYQVTIPVPDANFPTSSTFTDTADNQTDENDNGDQPGGQGTAVTSPLIMLTPGTEPAGEPGQGGMQDAAMDTNGDMTIDFGFIPAIFDLALVKTVSSTTPGPFMAGNTVTFDLEVINQGTVNAFNIGLVDYIPTGLILADPAWTLAGTSATLNTPIPSLAVGASTIVSISFTIDPAFQGTSILNDSEISEADDDMNPGNTPPTDVDSTPGNDGTPDDLVGNDDTADTAGGDDQDPEEIFIGQVFDLALIKTLSTTTPGPFFPGAPVVFDLEVVNQGTQDAFNVGLVDYIPAGLILADPAWTLAGTTATLTAPIGTIPVGTSTIVPIAFTIDPAFTGTSILNDSEISEADDDMDPTNTAPTDVDSTPGDDATPDDVTGNDDLADVVGGDDQDPEEVTVEFASIGSTVFEDPNDNGLQDAGEAGIPGVTVVLLDSTGATVATTTTDTNGDYFFGMLLPGTYQVTIPMPDANFPTSSTFTDTADNQTDENDNGDQPGGQGTAVTSPLIMLAIGTEPAGEPGQGGMQDAAMDTNGDMTIDFGFIPAMFDLALVKTVSSTTPGPFMAGNTVTFDLEVINQGTVNAFNIGLVDYIPTGLILNDPAWTLAGTSATLNTPIPSLAVGASTIVSISFTIDPAFQGTSILNDSEISEADDDMNPGNTPPTDVDSTPGDDGTPDDLVGNDDTADTAGGDDQDPEEIFIGQVFDLALIKTLSTTTPGPFFPGAPVVFDLEIVNQGTQDAFNVGLVDYIPAGLILADPAWTLAGTTATLTAPIGTIPVGTSTIVPIAFTIDPAFTGTSILNDSEISEADDDMDPTNTAPTDVDSTPGDDATPDDVAGNDDLADVVGGDDQDPEEVTVEFASIGSTVFEDPNDNGLQDAGEAGIPGVTVVLLDSTGATVATTITDTNGDYFFGMLLPGTYQVTIPVPDTNFPLSSTPTDTADNQTDENDNGDQPTGLGGPVVSPLINLALGTEPIGEPGSGGMQDAAMDANGDMTIDFGFIPVVCLEVRTDAISEGSVQPCISPGQTIERNIVTDDLEILPPGFQILYILVDQNGTIVTTNPLSFYNISAAGSFTAYSVAYNPAIYDVATATTFNEIVANLTCGDISAGLPIEVNECCQAFAGTVIQPVVDGCAGGGSSSTLTWSLINQNLPPGYVIEYILTDGATGLVLQTSATPSFTVALPDFYRVHSAVFLPSEFSLAGLANGVNTIFSINGGIRSEGLCADVNIIGGNFIVSDCCSQDLYLPGPGLSVPAGVYERDVRISSDGIINIGPTDFDAGVEIELLPGFEVSLGIEFHAFIDGCN